MLTQTRDEPHASTVEGPAGTALAGRRAPIAAPPSRDLFIDLLRLFGIALVVLQHWSMPVLSYGGGRITTGNALAAPGAFAITWISQVMPLVFFAGGAANAISHRAQARRGVTPSTWLAGRLRRLAWPLLPLAAVWIPLPHLLLALGLPAQPVETAAHLVGQLLWFLAVYVIAVTLTPFMLRMDLLHGPRVLVALGLGAVATDLVRFAGGVEAAGYVNVVFVWMAVHQLGFLYVDGRLQSARWMALGGFGIAAALVAFGPYPGSMVGMPGAPVSNMAPPTLVMLAVGCGQIGLALLLRPRLLRLASLPLAARLMTWAGPRMMTVYLWHMTALAVVTGVAVIGLGIATPAPWSGTWLAGWPLWLAALALALWPLQRRLHRFEEPPAPKPHTAIGWVRAGAAASLVGAGLVGLMITGFVPGVTPVVATASIACGLLLTGARAS